MEPRIYIYYFSMAHTLHLLIYFPHLISVSVCVSFNTSDKKPYLKFQLSYKRKLYPEATLMTIFIFLISK